jgi:enamine deaminase RidA (YjgF/YER057c/UK114 family)
MSPIDERLKSLNIVLPDVMPPFGERGIHSRSAVSVAQLPFGACVEIDMIAELEATQP